MKKTALSFLALLFAIVIIAQEKETRNEKDFTGVSFGVSGELHLTQGKNFSVTLEGDQDMLKQIETYVKNGNLVIRKKNWKVAMNRKVTVRVTMPEIDRVSVSGSGTVVSEGVIKSDELGIYVSGSGDVKLNAVSASELDCRISGSGSVNLSGSGARECDLSISGSGRYSGLDFEVDEMQISISGSGKCECNVVKQLDASISGSGDVYYSGSPSINVRSSGSGKVRKN